MTNKITFEFSTFKNLILIHMYKLAFNLLVNIHTITFLRKDFA